MRVLASAAPTSFGRPESGVNVRTDRGDGSERRPGSRGSAQPDPMTPRYANAGSVPRSHHSPDEQAPALLAINIESIELRNYRVCRWAELLWPPGFAVVVDANRFGKSTPLHVVSRLKEVPAGDTAAPVVRRGGRLAAGNGDSR